MFWGKNKTNFQKKRITIFLVCSAVAILSISLYYYNAIHRLRIQLVDVGLGIVGLTSAEIELKIEVYNPNALPIYIPNLDFEVYVNDQFFGNGYSDAFTVAGNTRYSKWISITFSYLDVTPKIADLIINHATVTVRLTGSAKFFSINIPFSTEIPNTKLTCMHAC